MGTRTGTYYTGTMTGQVGSLITALDTILITGEGWTSPYSGTNEKQYTQPAGNGFTLYVNDNGTGAAGAREAIVRACESSTGLTTLTDAFPSTVLVSDANCVWRKSDTADATTRSYWAVADDRFFVMVVQHGTNSFDCYMFGDVEPYWTGDNYATVVINRGTGNSSTAGLAMEGTAAQFGTSANSNLWFARTPSGTTKIDRGAIVGILTTFGNLNAATAADYPHPETSKLHMRPTVIRSNGSTGSAPADSLLVRGAVPYLFEMMHGTGITSLVPLDTWTDSAYDASSSFIVFAEGSSTVLTGLTDRYILQTAGTWDPGF